MYEILEPPNMVLQVTPYLGVRLSLPSPSALVMCVQSKEKNVALIDFIMKAKISGYASGGEGQERKFDDGSLGFEFMANGYKYLDRYYGFNPFSGTEHVYDDNGSLIWTMNYITT